MSGPTLSPSSCAWVRLLMATIPVCMGFECHDIFTDYLPHRSGFFGGESRKLSGVYDN